MRMPEKDSHVEMLKGIFLHKTFFIFDSFVPNACDFHQPKKK